MENLCDIFSAVLLIMIVNRRDGEKLSAIVAENEIIINFVALGKGTAPSKFKAYFGIGGKDKDVFFSITSAVKANKVILSLSDKGLIKDYNNGIALIVPVNSVIIPKEIEKCINEGEVMDKPIKKELIVAIVTNGFTEDAMDAARRAGALGGTMIYAKGVGIEKAEKFFGISLTPEKELVLIVASTDISKNIMNEINNSCGFASGANAFVFSLPVANFTTLAPLGAK